MRHRIAPVLALSLSLSCVPLVLTGGGASAAGTVERLSGSGRVATAVALSAATRSAGDTVVIARADAYADALSGAPLAAKLDAPVLLSDRAALSAEVAAEVERLGASTAYLLGGLSALSAQVEKDLRAGGVEEVVRLSGASRFDTARAVAQELGATAAYLVQGNSADPARGWPDAVSVSGLAAFQQRPILLTESDVLPDVVARTLTELGITEVGIVGGTAAVSAGVEQAVRERVASVYRIAGSSRYATARMVGNQSLNAGMSAARTWLATGRNYPDALAAGPAVAADGGVLLLVDGHSIHGSPDTVAWLDAFQHDFTRVRLVGGQAAIAADVETDVERVMAGLDPEPSPTPSPPPPPPPPSPEPTQPPPSGGCDPSYPTVCIAPPPPDLDCGDVPYRRFTVRQPDPHDFDRDRDGIGCES